MKLTTISEISKGFCISTRTLRYYEQIGLIQSIKKEDYAYRTYDEENVAKLRNILILRKLRIPLKQIGIILKSENSVEIIEVFQQNLNEIDEEITALSTVRDIIETFINRLNESIHQEIKLNLLDDTSLLEAVDALTIRKTALKEEKTAADLEQASEKLNKFTDRDVRIIYLPPMTLATASVTGENCEGKSLDMISRFILDNNLLKIKPDIRQFGFDCSAGQAGVGESSHKYQAWVSIPEDMDVPEPLVKRTFIGGLYAAHMIMMGEFDHWNLLREWVFDNEFYEHDWYSIRCSPYEDDMDRCFEEQLNYWNNVQNPDFNDKYMQLDLLFPIKEKK